MPHSFRSDLLVELHATVLNCWVEDDEGYGSTGFWTLNLRVHSWPSKANALKARIESNEAPDSDALYSLKGRMYISHGKEWTDAYLLIDSAKKFHGPGTIRSDVQPTFEVVAQIKAVHDSYISFSWQVWDDYETTQYSQTARANLAKRIPRSHTFINLLARIRGVMEGPDPKRDWRCGIIEPEGSEPSSPNELDTTD